MAKEELSRECDYELEAKNQNRFRELLSNAHGFYVPLVVDGISSKRVLTTELVSGEYFILFMFIAFFFLLGCNSIAQMVRFAHSESESSGCT